MEVPGSDLQKILDILKVAVKQHKARDEMNALLHLASVIRYSPLTSELEAAQQRLEAMLK